MPDEPRPLSWTEQGQAAGFDDAWHEEWWRRMEESGGNVIAAYRMRMVEVSDERVVMRVPYQPAARQGTGVYAAGVIIQLADVTAETTLTHAGRRLMVADSQIKDEDGRLLATMTSTHIVARR